MAEKKFQITIKPDGTYTIDHQNGDGVSCVDDISQLLLEIDPSKTRNAVKKKPLIRPTVSADTVKVSQ
jgi:hypothetical protein